MTTQEIRQKVAEAADARIGDTIVKLLETLRIRHTHQCWRKECCCEYCRFINGNYVNTKLFLHKLKKRIRHYEYLYHLTEHEMHSMLSVKMQANLVKQQIGVLKVHKKDLQGNIV